jgi:hypothetical protein
MHIHIVCETRSVVFKMKWEGNSLAVVSIGDSDDCQGVGMKGNNWEQLLNVLKQQNPTS